MLIIKVVSGHFEAVEGVVLDQYWTTDANGDYIPNVDMINGTHHDKEFIESFFRLHDQMRHCIDLMEGKGFELCGQTFVINCEDGGGSWVWIFYMDDSGEFIDSVTVWTDGKLKVEKKNIDRPNL